MSKANRFFKKTRKAKKIFLDISCADSLKIERKEGTPKKKPLSSSHNLMLHLKSSTYKPLIGIPRRSVVCEHDFKYEQQMQLALRELKIIEELPVLSMLDIVCRQVTLPGRVDCKSIIFDLDDTLVHTVQENSEVDAIFSLSFGRIGVKVRPFALQCLKEVRKSFEVIVFTASEQEYADAILDFIDPQRTLIKHRLYRNHCVPVAGRFVKDLRVIVNRRISKVAIVDNSCLSFANQIDNGIPIRSWSGDSNDKELFYLTNYLKKLANAEDIRDVNRKTFMLNGSGYINLRLC